MCVSVVCVLDRFSMDELLGWKCVVICSAFQSFLLVACSEDDFGRAYGK